MNKKILGILGGLVVALIAVLVVLSGHSTPAPAPVGGDVRNPGDSSPQGIQLGDLPVTVNWASGKIAAKSNTATWINTTGKVAYVDLLNLSTDGTASTTYTFYAYATTTAVRTLYDFVPPAEVTSAAGLTRMLINGTILGTSTIATSTSNFDGSTFPRVIRVPAGSRVNILLTQRYTTPCTGVQCETATSSNRGFNIQWRLRYHD
jgi:hypothetical protein